MSGVNAASSSIFSGASRHGARRDPDLVHEDVQVDACVLDGHWLGDVDGELNDVSGEKSLARK